MSGNYLPLQIPFGMDNNTSTNPGSFLDLSRKVDQILMLLQGSSQTLGQPSEPVIQSLMNIRSQISFSPISNDSVPIIDELRQILQKLDQFTVKSMSDTSTNPVLPLDTNHNSSWNLNHSSYDSRFQLMSPDQFSGLPTGFQLIPSSQLTTVHHQVTPAPQVAPPSQVIPPSQHSHLQLIPNGDQILNLLADIRARIGGSSLEESLSNSLNKLQQTIPTNSMIQSTQPPIMPDMATLRQLLIPGINDTLMQTSNTLISTIRNEIQNILGRYTDVNQSLNGLRNTISQSDPSTLARKSDIDAQFSQLSDKINQYTQRLQQLHDTTVQLVGQANDNSRLIYGIGNKMQTVDRLHEAVTNANLLLTQNTSSHRGDIDLLIQENLLLRQNLENLISALRSTTSSQNTRITKHR
jgi:hypothetical protein